MAAAWRINEDWQRIRRAELARQNICCPKNILTPGLHSTWCHRYLGLINCTCDDRFGAHPTTHNHQPACPMFEENFMTDYAMSADFTAEVEPTEPTEAQQVFDLSNASPEAAAAIAEAIERIRPLDTEQKNNLLDILREDSAAVEEQVRRAFQKVRVEKHAEIMAQFPEPETQRERFQIEAEELAKKQQKAMKKIVKAAKREGVTLKVHSMSYTPKEMVNTYQEVDNRERDKALMEARAPIDRAEVAALDSIREGREKADRQIRLSAVSRDATEILKHLPTPESITEKVGEAIIAAQADIDAGRPARRLLGRKGGW